MKGVADRLTGKLQVVRDFGWDLDSSNLDIVEDLFSECEKAAIRATDMRVIFGQYSMVLMFRFFVSFGSQARLAVVLKTMKAVMTDLLHFMIVFIPTFMAYAITGSLVFGRRIEAFSTIQGSIGCCFRIVFESDYDWEDMSAEFYWAAAMWAWSFLILVVLLMLNLVLAIILDVYSEVRETSFVGEAIWETVGNFFLRLLKSRTRASSRCRHPGRCFLGWDLDFLGFGSRLFVMGSGNSGFGSFCCFGREIPSRGVQPLGQASRGERKRQGCGRIGLGTRTRACAWYEADASRCRFCSRGIGSGRSRDGCRLSRGHYNQMANEFFKANIIYLLFHAQSL